MENYEIIGNIGEGAHGVVLKARCNYTLKMYALKKVYVENIRKQFPIKVWREINNLKKCNSPYVLKLSKWFCHRSSVVIVTDLMASDLKEVLSERRLNMAAVKRLMAMLLAGAAHLHCQKIMHRDLKPSNLLISFDGILKIADFSLSCTFSEELEEKPQIFSHKVASRWYRAPELLLGSQTYRTEVDLWSIGCIFVEMVNGAPLFPGQSDVEQLGTVINFLGTPNFENFPLLSSLPDYSKVNFPSVKPCSFKNIVFRKTKGLIDLAKGFLKYNGAARITCDEWYDLSSLAN
ncbi:hypothetical protein QYM36_015426, partial [Artemia franciscana]